MSLGVDAAHIQRQFFAANPGVICSVFAPIQRPVLSHRNQILSPPLSRR
jgi:hypothetical protein